MIKHFTAASVPNFNAAHVNFRAVWLILFLLMAVACVYITYLLLYHYYEYESYNLVFTQLAKSYTLPAC